MAELSEIGPFERFILRGAGPFAVAVPERPLLSAEIEGGSALWLGPDEWLLLLEEGRGAPVTARLGQAVLVDVSHRSVALRLSGTDAALLLNGVVALDLAEAAFPVGMCTRTLCGKAEIVLWRRGADAWHIEVGWSFAPYVRHLLSAIAQADGIALLTKTAPA